MEMKVQPRVWERREMEGASCGSMPIQGRSCERCEKNDASDEHNRTWTGLLPAVAPLANPFVPFQRYDPPTYAADKGAVRGTLFPGLDLPYRGMINEGSLSKTHLQELQSLSFAITELGEYLDTHSDDADAFALMKSYAELYSMGKQKYESMHGPLTQGHSAMMDSYQWLKDPWPWDYEANKMGG